MTGQFSVQQPSRSPLSPSRLLGYVLLGIGVLSFCLPIFFTPVTTKLDCNRKPADVDPTRRPDCQLVERSLIGIPTRNLTLAGIGGALVDPGTGRVGYNARLLLLVNDQDIPLTTYTLSADIGENSRLAIEEYVQTNSMAYLGVRHYAPWQTVVYVMVIGLVLTFMGVGLGVNG